MKKKCIICNKEFYKESVCSIKRWNEQRKFCSTKCHGLYNKKMGIKPPPRIGAKPWNYGKKFLAVSGEKNSHWKGGISKLYKTERHLVMETIEYKLWRRAIFERDNHTCQKCGIRSYKGLEKTVKIEAHHIKSWTKYPELRFAIDNGITLCIDCHHKITFSKSNYNYLQSWIN
jgi:hypothetical protein